MKRSMIAESISLSAVARYVWVVAAMDVYTLSAARLAPGARSMLGEPAGRSLPDSELSFVMQLPHHR